MKVLHIAIIFEVLKLGDSCEMMAKRPRPTKQCVHHVVVFLLVNLTHVTIQSLRADVGEFLKIQNGGKLDLKSAIKVTVQDTGTASLVEHYHHSL